ncbi:hypothetical protein ACG04R_09945 [Roseateles sp. BYS78W]|uniref:Uncharacterized protein n=1 Tax=Pelomonas candidula TaxID=3299025 RepID=A0ABW7HAQ6_9BURK
MKTLARTLIVAALVAATGAASAGPRGYYEPPRYHHHDGIGLGGLVFGLAVALPLIALAHEADRAPDVVYVPPPAPLPPPPVYVAPPPAYVAPSRATEPVIYPRNGQSNVQLEADHRDCNRWATTQPSAMNDTSVFNRAVDACMDARGYTLR